LDHAFRKALSAPGHSIAATDVAAFEGVVDLLRHFQERLGAARRSERFDWSQPISSSSPTPQLSEVEAKRWEFHESLMRVIEEKPGMQVDPLEVASSIGMHWTHAREFFVSLVRMGRLPRQRFPAEWRALANSVDAEEREVSPSSREQSRVCLRVFLCHASEDKSPVRELSRFLAGLGHDPWLDEEKLVGGQDWDQQIRQALRQSDVVLVCLSDKSSKRGYVQKELKRALDIADEFPDGEIYLIPVRLTDCPVPERLARLHYVDLHRPGGSERLRAALDIRSGTTNQ
jgi:hypothetical protein